MGVSKLLSRQGTQTVAELVKVSLQDLGYPQIGKLSCREENSTVILSGQLGSFYHSQMAQSIAAKVPGVRRVINRVNVCG